MIGVTLSYIVTLGTIRPENGGAAFEQKNAVSGRLGMPGGKFPIYAQNPLLGEWRETMEQPTMPFHLTLTSSSLHHSSHHRTALFLSITISLKWPLVLKSDVKQQFITTTTHPSIAYLCLVLIAKHKSGRLDVWRLIP